MTRIIQTELSKSMKDCTAFIVAAVVVLGTVSQTTAQDGQTLFITSAVENPDGTATFPLHRGTSHGQNVFYVILDASDGNVAQTLGVNTAPKLANARGTAAVQK